MAADAHEAARRRDWIEIAGASALFVGLLWARIDRKAAEPVPRGCDVERTAPASAPFGTAYGPVTLVVMPGFDPATAACLAKRMARAIGGPVRMATAQAAYPPVGGPQVDVSDLTRAALPDLTRLLRERGSGGFYFLTPLDINNREHPTRFLFSAHVGVEIEGVRAYVSYVSLARLADPDPALLEDRLLKLLLRGYAENQVGMRRTGRRDDLLYAPLFDTDDLDRVPMAMPAPPAPRPPTDGLDI